MYVERIANTFQINNMNAVDNEFINSGHSILGWNYFFMSFQNIFGSWR